MQAKKDKGNKYAKVTVIQRGMYFNLRYLKPFKTDVLMDIACTVTSHKIMK